jgi:predicted nucleotidyltransferase
MSEYYSIDTKKREEIAKKIKRTLQKENDVVFVFLFGSFLNAPSFRDIDVGVYMKDIRKENDSNLEVELAEKISKEINLPIDIIEVHILNFAPISFLNNVFSRGKMLFTKDGEFMSGLIEKSSLSAVVNEHIANQSLKELMAV